MTKESITKSELEIVQCLNDPFNSFQQHCDYVLKAKKACFVLSNASTKVSEREGISAAGSDAKARRLTPALDAEALVLGKTISSTCLPVSPRGIVSPVVITRACLRLLKMPVKVIDCGSFQAPKVEAIQVFDRPAECPSTGKALDRQLVLDLFEKGQKLGAELSAHNEYLVLAECVPGGTTTAFALLSALGHEVNGLLSSSLPSSNHEERWEIVKNGISKNPDLRDRVEANALNAVAAVGDAMQAVVSGIVLSATQKIPVYLAGGSQMLAVWALLCALKRNGYSLDQSRVFVLSTGWVAFDQSAGVEILAKNLSAPFAAACPEFRGSRHAGLQAYEEGNVKEGVGAGAAMCIANMVGFKRNLIINAIDDCYDELVATC